MNGGLLLFQMSRAILQAQPGKAIKICKLAAPVNRGSNLFFPSGKPPMRWSQSTAGNLAGGGRGTVSRLRMESKMQEYIIRSDKQRDLKFNGDLLAQVEGERHTMTTLEEDQEGRVSDVETKFETWTELMLYSTSAGNYVLHRRRQGFGGRTRDEAWVFSNTSDLVNHLEGKKGLLGLLDKQLLEKAAKTDLEIERVLYQEV
jgi:hypothetical protein